MLLEFNFEYFEKLIYFLIKKKWKFLINKVGGKNYIEESVLKKF